VVVDVAGLPNDMSILSDLAEQYEFILVEDAAESMGGEYKRRRVGSHGHTVTLSFHAAKQLTTVEGGAVLTDNPTIANRCRIIRNHGEVPRRKYVSRLVGGNFRTTDLQSAIGIAQLRKLDKYLTRRNEIVRQYREELSKLFRFQVVPSYVTKHAYMMFMTISRSNRIRNNLQQHLEKRGIETRVPWPPLHRQAQFRTVDTAFHESSRLYEKVLSLPLYNTMRDSDVERVVSEVLASNMH
jgi:perosamine synthetase